MRLFKFMILSQIKLFMQYNVKIGYIVYWFKLKYSYKILQRRHLLQVLDLEISELLVHLITVKCIELELLQIILRVLWYFKIQIIYSYPVKIEIITLFVYKNIGKLIILQRLRKLTLFLKAFVLLIIISFMERQILLKLNMLVDIYNI